MKKFAATIGASVLLVVLLISLTAAHAAAAGAAGSLDATFGNAGVVLTNLGGTIQPSDVVEQSNGDIVVSATIGNSFGVVRYLPNGSLDTAFGHGGVASANFSASIASSARALALQSNGMIVLVGGVEPTSGGRQEFGVARFTTNGTLDATFGKGGMVETQFFAQPLATAFEVANSVVVQPDGKLVVGGSATQGGRFSPTFTALARYNANGSLDTTFGNRGEVLANINAPIIVNSPTGANALGLDTSGDIFVLNHAVIAEFSADGSLDATVQPASITASSHGGVNAFLSDGRYLSSTGVAVTRQDQDLQAVRFNQIGTVDTTFANPPFDFGPEGGSQNDAGVNPGVLALQANGQVVVAGTHVPSGSFSTFGVARLNVDGSLDASFGKGGVVTTSFSGDATVAALVIQSDGKIVVVGASLNPATGTTTLALTRYLG